MQADAQASVKCVFSACVGVVVPSHSSASSFLIHETTIIGPRVEGTCIHRQPGAETSVTKV